MCCSFSAQAMSIGPSACFDASVAGVEENVPLARYTTIGTGRPARWFTRPATIEQLQDALRWAKERDVPVETIGLGSNVLAHDDGVEALVVKLDGDLIAAEVRGDVLVAGGGAPNAVASASGPRAGLAGFEFASAIPGTTGGGVRMNAGAYGREWKDVMIDAVVVDADYVRTLTAVELGLSYRHSALRAGEVVAQVRFQLEPSTTEAVKARVAELLTQRKAAQPTNKRTFGSVFKNPAGDRGAGGDRGMRAQGPADRGCAGLAAPRELHRELGRCHERRRLALMAAAADGYWTGSVSSSSTRCGSSGPSTFRPCRGSAGHGEVGGVAAPKRSTARTAVLPVRRALPELGRIAPSGARSSSGSL